MSLKSPHGGAQMEDLHSSAEPLVATDRSATPATEGPRLPAPSRAGGTTGGRDRSAVPRVEVAGGPHHAAVDPGCVITDTPPRVRHHRRLRDPHAPTHGSPVEALQAPRRHRPVTRAALLSCWRFSPPMPSRCTSLSPRSCSKPSRRPIGGLRTPLLEPPPSEEERRHPKGDATLPLRGPATRVRQRASRVCP